MDDNLKRFLFASRVLAIGSLAALAGSALSTWLGSSFALDAEVAQVALSEGERDGDENADGRPDANVAAAVLPAKGARMPAGIPDDAEAIVDASEKMISP